MLSESPYGLFSLNKTTFKILGPAFSRCECAQKDYYRYFECMIQKCENPIRRLGIIEWRNIALSPAAIERPRQRKPVVCPEIIEWRYRALSPAAIERPRQRKPDVCPVIMKLKCTSGTTIAEYPHLRLKKHRFGSKMVVFL